MRLGAAERLGIDYPAVAARNPRIIYAAATGFRKEGAFRDRPSFDDVIQGESGLAALNGGSGEPRYVPMAVCDKICGYVLASAIGMALFHRERTGEGQEVHVPMLETMVAFNLVDHLWHGVLAEPEKGLGYPRMLTGHRRPFPTKDGHICILATTDAQSRICSRRSSARSSPMTSASRPWRGAPTTSASSTKSSSTGCAGGPPPNGASGSTRSMSPTVWSPISKACSPIPISAKSGSSGGSSIPPRGRC
jgi:crotonobetainyl-CoA:carnitine CoA-transferase CaiB-like acyl-CoA transferase